MIKRSSGKIWSKERKETVLSDFEKDLNLSPIVQMFCKDEGFVKAFIQSVPNEEEQKKYLINSSKYVTNDSNYDPNYVLFFRRTLPSNSPKHEERRTNIYIQVRNGLRREIPEGPHRLHSVILCDSLKHLLMNGEKTWEMRAFTDGEIVVKFPDYDQNTCICKFKPLEEQEALEEYLKIEGAIALENILQKIKKHKTNLYSSLNG